MNYNLFSKIVALTTIFSWDYKKNLLLETKDFSSWELEEIVKFIYAEEEKILTESKQIIFQKYENPIIKTKFQIKNIIISWKYLNKLLILLKKNIKAWISLFSLDQITEKFLKDNNLKSSFKWVDGYKYNISVSINNKIFHHIPWKYILKKWDLITIDTWIDFKWWITDSAFCMVVWWEKYNYKAQFMLYFLKNILDKHLNKLKPWYNLYDFSFDFYNDIISTWLNIIKNSSGHWVWNALHEEPWVYFWPCEYMKNIILKPWMIFALEPLITWKTQIALIDKNNKWYAEKWDIWGYFEYSILITNTWYKIISWLKKQKINKPEIKYDIKEFVLWNKKYFLQIADTIEKQELWLMFREKLDNNMWMIFDFKKMQKTNFTMKNTFINLDILWLDNDFNIIFIKENVKNCFDIYYEEIIKIDTKVKYVIELNAWELEKNSIKICNL